MNKGPDIYRIAVSKPCTESWDDMLPEAQGKYCLSCQKQVLDFSVMSDAEIIDILKHNTGSICGRMLATQQHRDIVAVPVVQKRSSFLNPVKYAAGLLLGLGTQEALAQDKPEAPIMEQTQAAVIHHNTGDTLVLHGVVQDTNHEAIPGAVIKIRGEGTTTVCDEEGVFKLPVPTSLWADKQFVIVIFSMGMPDEVIEITAEMLDQKNIFTVRNSTVISDEVSIYGRALALKKRHWWQFWKPKYYLKQ